MFALYQALEKTYVNKVESHNLFVGYKATFDSPIRKHVFAAIS